MNKLSLVTAAALLVGVTQANASWYSWDEETPASKKMEKKQNAAKAAKEEPAEKIETKVETKKVEETVKKEEPKLQIKDEKMVAPKELSGFTRESIVKDNQKEIYVDKYLNVFVPQEELYVYLALSDDPSADKVFLPNRKSASEHQIYPVKLGKPGHHTIAHMYNKKYPTADGNLKEADPSRYMNVTWDNTPPVLKLVNTDTKTSVKDSGSLQYFKGSSSFKISANDDYSGTKSVYMSLDGGAPQMKNDGDLISGLQEGRHSVSFYTVDNVGNVSEKIKKDFIIDGTNPNTYIQIHTSSKGEDGLLVAGPDSSLSMSAIDKDSQVDKIYYKISRPVFDDYQTPVPLRVLKSGKYTIQYYGVDKVGNKEPVQKMDFYMDNNAPKTELSASGDLYSKGGKKYISGRTKFDLKATDYAGVRVSYLTLGKDPKSCDDTVKLKKIEYKNEIASADMMNKFKNKKQGEFYLGYNSIDNVGNEEKTKFNSFFLDKLAPVLNFKFSGEKLYKDGVYYVGSDTLLTFYGKDNLSGIADIQYKVDGKDYVSYKEPLKVGKNQYMAKMDIEYFATDNVNNKSKVKKLKIAADNKAPEILHHFSFNGKEAKSIKLKDDENKIMTFPEHTKLYIAAEDEASGTKDIFYTINGSKTKKYTQPVELHKIGEYEIKIVAVDRLGNKSETSNHIRVVSLEDKRIENRKMLEIDYKEGW